MRFTSLPPLLAFCVTRARQSIFPIYFFFFLTSTTTDAERFFIYKKKIYIYHVRDIMLIMLYTYSILRAHTHIPISYYINNNLLYPFQI